jgi:hypothetical protein
MITTHPVSTDPAAIPRPVSSRQPDERQADAPGQRTTRDRPMPSEKSTAPWKWAQLGNAGTLAAQTMVLTEPEPRLIRRGSAGGGPREADRERAFAPGGYTAWAPWSTWYRSPEVKEASSLTRCTATAATSSGRPHLPCRASIQEEMS